MRRKVPIIAIIAIIVVALGFAGLVVVQRKNEQQRMIHIQALQQEAAPYEDEINNIQEDLDKREKEMLSQELPTANVVVGFTAASSGDIDTAKKLTENYDFEPSIVLNCTQGISKIRQYLWKITSEKYDVILTGDTIDEDTLKTADEVYTRLTSNKDSTEKPVFLLKQAVDTEANRKLLENHGYTKIFRDSETLDSGSEGSLLYLPYQMIEATTASDSLADAIAATHSGAAVVFDTAELENAALTEQNIKDCLDTLNGRKSNGSLAYADVETAFQDLKESENEKQQYNSYKNEQEARLESLQQQVREIYAQWDDYK